MKETWVCSDMTVYDSFYEAQLHQNLLNEFTPKPNYLYGISAHTDNKLL